MTGLLLRLYPARWRHRYGEEFRVLLESRPLGPFDVADVLLGALDARLTPLGLAGAAGTDGGPLVMLRLGGIGAVAGGALWFTGLFAAGQAGEDRAWGALIALGTVGLLLALIGLSAFQAHRHPRLVWAAFVIPALGSLVSVVGLAAMVLSPSADPTILGSISAWYVWIFGLLGTVVGSIIFAVATIRAAVFSRRAAQSLAGSSAIVLLFTFGLIGGGDAANGAAQLIMALGLGSFAASWIALGILALRRGPIRAIAPA